MTKKTALKNLRVFITEKEIQKRIDELSERINHDYADKNLVAICILKGGVVFFVDMIRKIRVPLTCEFLAVSSYGSEKQSSGEVKLVFDVQFPLHGRHVLVFEDIVDSGVTLNYLLNLLKAREPASLKVCSLLFKPQSLKTDVRPDYYGFEIGNEFVVGYGLDYAGHYRGTPYVGVLES